MKKSNLFLLVIFSFTLFGCNASKQEDGPVNPPEESAKYIVTWQNYDGTILEIDKNIKEGTSPSYNGVTPYKSSEGDSKFIFDGWSPELSPVTGNTTYTATFREEHVDPEKVYTVTWQNYDGTILEIDKNIKEGTSPSYNGVTPYKSSEGDSKFIFDGWSPELSPVTGNTTYTATFKEDIIVPDDVSLSYTFKGDNKDNKGYAEGEIVLSSDKKLTGNYSIYWGNKRGKLASYPLATNVISSTNTSKTFEVAENIAIPYEAEGICAYDNNNFVGYFEIEQEKRQNQYKHKYAVISDVHMNIASGQKYLENALKVFEENDVEYVIVSGDIANNAEQYAYYEAAIIDSGYSGLIFACIGNHDQNASARSKFILDAIYDGSHSCFVPLDTAENYFKSTYNNENLPVSVYYEALEGVGNTYYYYAIIDDNMFFFMDQMLAEGVGTPRMDNFSKKQLDLLENTLYSYSQTHNLYIIEHAPIEQLKEGDVFPSKYGGQIFLSYNYDNCHRFLDILLEYPEAVFYNGHTHVKYDTGINFMDHYVTEYYEETDTPMARCFHVSSTGQTRWYEGSSWIYGTNFTTGSEGYICYEYEDSIVNEAHSFKEYTPSSSSYDPTLFENLIIPEANYIVNRFNQTHKLHKEVNFATIENFRICSGNPSFVENDNGVDITLSNKSDSSEIKMGDLSETTEKYFNFYFKSSSITSFSLGGCNKSGTKYKDLFIDTTKSGENYMSIEKDGVVHIQVPISILYTAEIGNDFALRIFNTNNTGMFTISNFQILSYKDISLRGEQLYYNFGFTKYVDAKAYSLITFEYKIVNDGQFPLFIMDSNWSKFYGSFEFNKNGLVRAYDGITTEKIENGFIRVTINVGSLKRTYNANNLNNAPATIGIFYIRGDWNTSIGVIDKIYLE